MMLQLIDMFQHHGKNIDVPWAGRWVMQCSDHDHLLRCGQTVAPRYRVLKAFQCKIGKHMYEGRLISSQISPLINLFLYQIT